MKTTFAFWIALFIPLSTLAQVAQFASVSTPANDTNLSPKRSLGILEKRILPLFGESPKTSEQIDDEIRFLSDCDKSFSSRTEASSFFAARAWEYLQEGSLDTACYRFNLAHLLNDKNMEAYWGLGVVSYQREDWLAAKSMLSKGVNLKSENVPLLVDLSTIDLKLYALNNNSEDLQEAKMLLTRAESLDSTYAMGQYNLALLYYNLEEFDQSWNHVHKGRLLDFSQINCEFVQLLKAKMPDPLNFFK